jgi:hypothetical protein
MHPYIDPGLFILVPPAHNVLRGLLRQLFIFALKTTAADLSSLGIAPDSHLAVFDSAANLCSGPRSSIRHAIVDEHTRMGLKRAQSLAGTRILNVVHQACFIMSICCAC